MANMNRVFLIGHLTREPELRHTNNGTAVCETGLAINERHGENEVTVFVDLVCWQRVAETVQRYCRKGDPLFVEGRLLYDTWQDKQTGANRSKLRVVADRVQFLSKAPEAQSEAQQQQGGYQQPQNQSQAQGWQRQPQQGGFTDPNTGDDIPF